MIKEKEDKKLHFLLVEELPINPNIRIIEAAKLGEVSPSKVSKLVQKMGFKNFKQYKLYFSGGKDNLKISNRQTSEIDRLANYSKNYDPQIIDSFLSVFNHFKKIIIFGLGPSFISAEYFAYKLPTVTDKNVFVTHNEDYAIRLADEDTLLIVLSVTGKFASFETLFYEIHEKRAQIMLVLEEYVNMSEYEADYIFHLTNYHQNEELLPFEKTRTLNKIRWRFKFLKELF